MDPRLIDWYLLLILFSSTSYGLCPAEFKGNCQCGYGQKNASDKYVTNCTDTDLDSTEILKDMPIDTEILIFTGNNVLDLPLNIFGVPGAHDKLRVIDLSSNHIQTIKGRTFHDVNSVVKLILNDNDIYLNGKDNHPRMFSNFINLEELHLRNAFTEKLSSAQYVQSLKGVFVESGLTKLAVLNLEQNEFSSIEDKDFFCTLPMAKELRLGENHLTAFTFNMECLNHLEFLDLSQNRISYLKNDTLESFDSINNLVVNLTGNPFRCDCHMVDMFLWMSHTRTRLVDLGRYQCVDGFPPKNIGRLLSNITLFDLQCRVYVNSNFDDHISATYVVLSLLIIVFAVLIGVLAYRNRRPIYESAFRFSTNIRRKFTYDSLDKPDEAEIEV